MEKIEEYTACCTLDISGSEQEKLVEMFKALGNPTRFEIMKFLVTHPTCITGDIVDYLPIAQATVSQWPRDRAVPARACRRSPACSCRSPKPQFRSI